MRIFIPHKMNHNGSEMHTIPLQIGLNCCIKAAGINNIGETIGSTMVTDKMLSYLYGTNFILPQGLIKTSMYLDSTSTEHIRGIGVFVIDIFNQNDVQTDKLIIEFQYIQVEV